jgi:RNA polymerase sigma factor (sigma-70 family)
MKTSTLEQTDFDTLLDWLSPDRDEAGKKYEEIRDGLRRFFRFKGVINSEELADEAISRVAARVKTFDYSKDVKTITYFIAFATNILHEYKRDLKKETIPIDGLQIVQEINEFFKHEDDERIIFMKECLKRFSPEERDLLLEYYGEERRRKIEIRKRLAEQFKCEMSVLHVRVHRLKSKLGNCIRKKMKKSL